MAAFEAGAPRRFGSDQRTLLPHALALLYGIAIAFASLQPFSPWIPPDPATPFWPLSIRTPNGPTVFARR